MKKKVFVGFSGGVDSSICAYLLKKKYDVSAVMFENTQNPSYNHLACENAKKVAEYLDIPLTIVDMKDEFQKMVINPFVQSYQKGFTPNPCVMCNKKFKFGYFADWCLANGADLIATGHYCKTENGRLFMGNDKKKDQSYFLNGVSSEILKKTLFPVGKLTKDKVRSMASKIGLPNSKKADSQEICFIHSSLAEFLNQNIESNSGNIVDIDTEEILGEHSGIHSLTVGQRKGIRVGGSDMPYFVAQKDFSTNTIYVAKGKMNSCLWKDAFSLSSLNLIDRNSSKPTRGLSAKVRYSAPAIACTVDWNNMKICLKSKVWTPSIGQSLVIYKGKECLGGGIIENIG